MTVFSQSESPGRVYFDGGNIFIDCVFMNSVPGGDGVDAGYYGDGFAGGRIHPLCIHQPGSRNTDMEQQRSGWGFQRLLHGQLLDGHLHKSLVG